MAHRFRPEDAPPAAARTAEAITEWLRRRLAQEIGRSPAQLDGRALIASYGLDSATAVGLAGEIGAWLGRKISPTLLYDHPTLEALASHLADGPANGTPAVRAPAPAAASAAPSAADLDTADGDELAAILERELAAIETPET